MQRRSLTCALLAAVLFSIPLDAQEGTAADLITDRPDQTESSFVVPRDSVQIEIGWQRTENDDDGVKSVTDEMTQTLVRIGIHQNFEVRLGFAGYIGLETKASGAASVEDHGAGDLSIGGKVVLSREEKGWPAMAFLAGISVPTGEESSERFDPSFRLLTSWTITDSFGIGANLGVAWESEEDLRGSRHTLSSLEYTVVFGAALTDQLGAFVEYFGDAGLSRQGGPRNSIDGGFTYLARPNLQFDLAVGVGVSEDADDWFVGFGISLRLPK